ncbi:MAG: ABC transporter substrate-binding protein [Gammaproteobacteria bacterium]|nr:ABC transporter substrate-binding protein [Gammaproteobacteria bacterium]
MKLRRTLTASLASMMMAISALAANLPTIKLGTLATGTVNWELTTIKANKLDEKHGFNLEVLGLANNDATKIALQSGDTNLIVSDWIWAAKERARGNALVFLPYSKAVGGVYVKADSDIQTLADLKGKKIGIAGGPVDKSWVVIQAYAQQLGFNLKAESEQVFGAPPLIMQSGMSGDVDAAMNFWHFNAKMRAAGMREVISVETAANALGLSSDTPLLGYIAKQAYIDANADLMRAFAAAAYEAKALLASDDSAWESIRDIMNVKNDKQFEALKAGYRAGIPSTQQVDHEAAAQMFAVMAKLGGQKLVGDVTDLPDGLFVAFE